MIFHNLLETVDFGVYSCVSGITLPHYDNSNSLGMCENVRKIRTNAHIYVMKSIQKWLDINININSKDQKVAKTDLEAFSSHGSSAEFKKVYSESLLVKGYS